MQAKPYSLHVIISVGLRIDAYFLLFAWRNIPYTHPSNVPAGTGMMKPSQASNQQQPNPSLPLLLRYATLIATTKERDETGGGRFLISSLSKENYSTREKLRERRANNTFTSCTAWLTILRPITTNSLFFSPSRLFLFLFSPGLRSLILSLCSLDDELRLTIPCGGVPSTGAISKVDSGSSCEAAPNQLISTVLLLCGGGGGGGDDHLVAITDNLPPSLNSLERSAKQTTYVSP